MGGAADLLKESLVTFYSNKENAARVIPIIKQEAPISLRLLEYFVVNYAKENRIVCQVGNSLVNINNSYYMDLKRYRKDFYDPFRRRGKLHWSFPQGEAVETTIGQLCFLKWALQYQVLDYVEQNREVIAENMSNRSVQRKSSKQEQTDRTVKTRVRKRRRQSKPDVLASYCIPHNGGVTERRIISW
jgi:hypothetical protein